MTTFDTIAVRILLNPALTPAQRTAELRRNADQARAAAGEACPECDCTVIECNGHTGRWAEYRCTDCDHRFGPGAEA